MKSLATYLLLLLMATQAFSKWVLLLEFRLNQESIALNLCENRKKPQTKCGGKCQLTKTLAADADEEKGGTAAKSKFSETVFPLQTPATDAPILSVEASPRNAVLPHLHGRCHQCRVFHPPLG